MKSPRRIKIVVGTRGSQLALTQTQLVVGGLQARWADLKFEVKAIKTRGDDPKTAIPDIRGGRKGLFTGEIERALITDDVDLAVHSAKDLPSTLAPGTEIAAVPPRAIVRAYCIPSGRRRNGCHHAARSRCHAACHQ